MTPAERSVIRAADIEAIRRRAEMATPGPWVVEYNPMGDDPTEPFVRMGPPDNRSDSTVLTEPDADFIAHARQDVPDLCAEVTRLQSALAQAEAEKAELIAAALPITTREPWCISGDGNECGACAACEFQRVMSRYKP